MNASVNRNTATAGTDHLPWLDGLRGGAAIWVLVSHVQILSGVSPIVVLSWGDLAVDLFMMLSGFLMAHHYFQRREREPWESPATFVTFWIRRFFRIAPLYYATLLAALLLGPWLGDWRTAIAQIWPNTATSPDRYSDQSLANIISHVTFAFGFLPHFAFRTPLPDWSIGLEMQFYLVFPMIMLTVARFGPIKASVVLIAIGLSLQAALPDFFRQFQMPAFLPMKLQIFLIGIWIAIARSQPSMRQGFLVALLLATLWLSFERSLVALARIGLVAGLFYLMDNGSMPASASMKTSLARIRRLLSGSVSRFLGNTSYATYLVPDRKAVFTIHINRLHLKCRHEDSALCESV